MSPRVGIDLLPAVTHAPGLGRYAREFVRAAVQLEHGYDLRLFEIGGGQRLFDRGTLGLDGRGLVHRASHLPRRAFELWSRLTGRDAARVLGGVDLFHRILPDYPPVKGCRQLLPLAELPRTPSSIETLHRMDGLLVFSQAYERRLIDEFGLPAERVFRVPVGCDHWTRDLGARRPARERRVIVLGAIRSARDPLSILHAFEELRDGGVDAQLLFVGRPGNVAHAFDEARRTSIHASAVEWIDEPVEAHMPALVAGSSLLVHLAHDEGTAVTPLEALAFGLPAVVSALPAFEEALGAHALYVEAEAQKQPERLAALLERGLAAADSDDATRARREHAATFTWADNARQTFRVWDELLRDSG